MYYNSIDVIKLIFDINVNGLVSESRKSKTLTKSAFDKLFTFIVPEVYTLVYMRIVCRKKQLMSGAL